MHRDSCCGRPGHRDPRAAQGGRVRWGPAYPCRIWARRIRDKGAILKLAAVWIGLVACPGGAMSAWATESVQVFVMHSYSQEYPWTRRQHQGFMDALRENFSGVINASVEYLDTKRTVYSADYGALVARHLEAKYSGYRPDIVYVTDDNALSFAMSHLSRVFPGTPVFFSGVNDFGIRDRLDRRRVTGVFERKEIAPNLELMRRIAPRMRDILIVGDGSETYAAIRRAMEEELGQWPDIGASFISNRRLEDLVRSLVGRKEQFLFLTTLGAVTDAGGRTLGLGETIPAILDAGRFTVFSMEDVYMYPGVLGGFVTSGRRQGEVAAGQALRYLRGTPLAQIEPVTQSPNEYLIDASELEKTGLVLPPEVAEVATFINSLPSFYQRYQKVILGSLYVLAGLFLALLGISLSVVMAKNRQVSGAARALADQAKRMAEIQDSLNRAQSIAKMGNWDWGIVANKLYWSEGIFRLFGIEPTEFPVSYEEFLARVHPADRERVSKAVHVSLEQGTAYDIVHRIVRLDGEVRVVHQSAETLRGSDGTVVRMIGTIQDITERHAAEQAFRESEEKLRTVLEGVPLILWAIDNYGRFMLCRGAGLRSLDLRPDELAGESAFEYYREHPEVVADLHRVLAGEDFVQVRSIADLAFQVHYSPLRDAGGRVTGAIGVAADITQHKQNEERLAFLANYDPITSLPNRTLFRDRLDQAMRRAERQGGRIGLLFIDLDEFKSVNDTLGHAAGDELLVQVAQRLHSIVRSADTVSRLGGDEFTVLLENLVQGEDAACAAAKIGNAMARPFQVRSNEVYVTPSIGIALYPADGRDVDTLLMNADAAMYCAKENGRNNFQFFTKALNARAQERLELGNKLRGAVERGEFVLHYQPQVDLRQERVTGFEALLRWNANGRGLVPPAAFVPVLEETGLIVQVGEWVLHEACQWAAGLSRLAGEPPSIAVNVSPRQFRQQDLHDAVSQALRNSGLDAARLELEITESSLVVPQISSEITVRLKELGVRLSVDDFGTGYSSLSYLKRFPVDRLKIDASFVRDLATNPDDESIATAIIGLGHNLGRKVIAEGVESRQQLEILRQRGCDEVQGYLFSKPMTGDQAKGWLEAWTGAVGA